ncbi:MAG: hypothetical protein IPM15_06850 [Betaproteobacteria bacterium]|jgi:peroxiredoxin family protein|nr:hypothetical protein [Betaproteobacteria bacterium]MCC6249283.1 hypothetical protein [Rubrivivax sp.]MCL4698743.1 hypothetical protein [Burkholderiaceae bacterium]
MLFGLVVTDRRHAAAAAGLLAGAAARGWEARCFLTDTGVQLLDDEAFMAEARARPLSVAVCRHSVDHLMPDCDIAALGKVVVMGSQFQGAKLAQNAQALLVL